ncbi:hypothetical protein MVEN_00076900 [Mycena venus]|uniref:Uncharacterized protein n=1 Tax=Mycena venus TaxID=2733690 RepID=A0A8H7DH94_9AGAR|nr:hypothetical protein MVEN_00076900 [Mycena venus]
MASSSIFYSSTLSASKRAQESLFRPTSQCFNPAIGLIIITLELPPLTQSLCVHGRHLGSIETEQPLDTTSEAYIGFVSELKLGSRSPPPRYTGMSTTATALVLSSRFST